MGELIQLPLSSEYGCFVPRSFLAPKARPQTLSVHGGEGPQKPQAFCHRGKSPSLERGFETAVSLQQRGSTGCAHPWRARHLVGGIAAQGDKIWNLGGIDAIPRANLGGADTRAVWRRSRSEEHTSELQSLRHLVCRLLLEKKKK